MHEALIFHNVNPDNPFYKVDPLEQTSRLFSPCFYMKLVFYSSVGPIYSLAAENADERNTLYKKAIEQKHGFGYPSFTRETGQWGAISDQDSNVIVNFAKGLKVRDIGNVSPI